MEFITQNITLILIISILLIGTVIPLYSWLQRVKEIKTKHYIGFWFVAVLLITGLFGLTCCGEYIKTIL